MEPEKQTPREQITELKSSNHRESKLLMFAAIFIIALGAILYWMLSRDSANTPQAAPTAPQPMIQENLEGY